MIGYELEKASPRHFSLPAVLTIEKLIAGSAIAADPELLKVGLVDDLGLFCVVIASLLQDTFFHLVANLRLWIYTDPAVQKQWLRVMSTIVKRQPELLRQEVRFFLCLSLCA